MHHLRFLRAVALAFSLALVLPNLHAASPAGPDVIIASAAAPPLPWPGHQVSSASPPLRPSNIVVPRLDAAPRLEDLLNPWKESSIERRMLVIHDFVQRYPEDGSRPSEPTTAYLSYTHDALYIGFVCRDTTPAQIRSHLLARDSPGDDDDVFVMLDTFHDQRRAFLFQSNPLGIQSDALYSEQTGYDMSFDTVWDTWGKRTTWGYAVLMRIPFASLYFEKAAPGEMRTWGIILGRNISHANESDYWPRINHNIAGRLTQDRAVDGFRDVRKGQNLQLEPYVLARNLRQLNTIDPLHPYFEHKHLQAYGGLDAKFILHNSLVLDTTVNPDFSQVGIDNPAEPNQRFPPFFAEVRPFFIENSSYFMTPYNLYYTNNIVKPQYGARLTGKLGGWAMGVLAVDDQSPGQLVPPGDPQFNKRAHFYLGRLNRDVGPLSNVGIIYADREYVNSYNRAGGLDYRFRWKNRWTLTGMGVTSDTRNLSNGTTGEQACEDYSLHCSGQGWYDQLSYTDLHLHWWAAYTDTAAGYVTDTGFFQRPDVRQPNGVLSYTFRPAKGPIQSHGFRFYTERIWDHTGVPLDYYAIPGYSFNFKARTSLNANVTLGQDRLRPIDYPTLKHDVEYHSQVASVSFYTSPVQYLALNFGYNQGKTINYSPPPGHGPDSMNESQPVMSLEIKPISFLDLQNNYTYSHFTDPASGTDVYDNHELISRWNYQITKAASVNLIGQYISTLPHPEFTGLPNSKTLFADALFTYMPHPGTALYFGYIGNFANIDRALCTQESNGSCNPNDPILPPTYSSLMNDGKTIYLKMSYLLRF